MRLEAGQKFSLVVVSLDERVGHVAIRLHGRHAHMAELWIGVGFEADRLDQLGTILTRSLDNRVQIDHREGDVLHVVAVLLQQLADLLVVGVQRRLEHNDDVVLLDDVTYVISRACLQSAIEEVLEAETSTIPASRLSKAISYKQARIRGRKLDQIKLTCLALPTRNVI